MTIRSVAESDAEAVAQLCGELGYPSDADAIRRRLRLVRHDDLLVVAVNEADAPIGVVHATTTCTIETDMRVHIIGLVVSSTARRMGVGRRLVVEVESWARLKGAGAVVLRSNLAGGEAHLFYQALGYAKVKTQAV